MALLAIPHDIDTLTVWTMHLYIGHSILLYGQGERCHSISMATHLKHHRKSQAHHSMQQPEVVEPVLSGCSPGIFLRNPASGTDVRFDHRVCGGIAPEIQGELCGHRIL